MGCNKRCLWYLDQAPGLGLLLARRTKVFSTKQTNQYVFSQLGHSWLCYSSLCDSEATKGCNKRCLWYLDQAPGLGLLLARRTKVFSTKQTNQSVFSQLGHNWPCYSSLCDSEATKGCNKRRPWYLDQAPGLGLLLARSKKSMQVTIQPSACKLWLAILCNQSLRCIDTRGQMSASICDP